ncbi:MAG: Sjogren's syndrome/scleroderma autoantigen 1 family protein [Nitrososphaeria archaeon]
MEKENNILREMANLLRERASMLSYVCPDCKVPLFKLKSGKIICPSCKRMAVFSEEINESIKESDINIKRKEKSELNDYLNIKIYNILTKLFDKLQKSDDVDEMRKIIILIERLVKLLNNI